MRLPQHLSIGGTDRVDLNIAALNSHDGTSAFRLLVTPVRVVCANTQHAALRDHVLNDVPLPRSWQSEDGAEPGRRAA